MKKWLVFSFYFFIPLLLLSQSIKENKIIHSNAGVAMKLVNGYGVCNVNESMYSSERSRKVEVVDLQEKGFLIRQELKVMLFSNDLAKTWEADLSEFYHKELNKINIYVTPEGFYFIQNFSFDWKENFFKVAFIDLSGKLEVAQINFDSKIGMYLPFYHSKENKINIVVSSKESDPVNIVINSPGLKYEKNLLDEGKNKEGDKGKNRTEEFKAERAFLDSSFFKVATGKFYKAKLSKFDDQGNAQVVIEREEEGKYVAFRTTSINIPGMKDVNNLYGYVTVRDRIKLAINEHTGDGYVVIYNGVNVKGLNAFIIVKFSLLEEKVYVNAINKNDLKEKYAVYPEMFQKHALTEVANGEDAWFYFVDDYFIINLHGRAAEVGYKSLEMSDGTTYRYNAGQSTVNSNTMLQLTVDNKGDILKIENMSFGFNANKHDDLLIIPYKVRVLFKSEQYKESVIDMVYSKVDDIDGKKNVFKILSRKDHTLLIRFEQNDSKIEVWKIEN